MTLAFYGLLIYIIYIEIKYRSSYEPKLLRYILALLFFELFANSGKIASIMDFEIHYGDLLWVVILVNILLYVKVIIAPNTKLFAMLFFFCLVVTTICEYFLYKTIALRSVLLVFRFALAIFICVMYLHHLDYESLLALIKGVITLQKITYCILLIQFFMQLIFRDNTFHKAVSYMFGVSINQFTVLQSRGELFALQGLCKEPSHLAIALFFVSAYDLWAYKNYSLGIKLFWINCLILLVSGSLSSILFVSMLLLFSAIYFRSILIHKSIKMADYLHINTKFRLFIFTILSCFILICSIVFLGRVPIISYYFSRISRILTFKTGSIDSITSEGMRFNDILGAVNNYLKSPFFGVGVGSSVALSGFLSLLSSVGSLGTFILFLNYGNGINRSMTSICALLLLLFCTSPAMDIGVYYSIHVCIYFTLFIKNDISYTENCSLYIKKI